VHGIDHLLRLGRELIERGSQTFADHGPRLAFHLLQEGYTLLYSLRKRSPSEEKRRNIPRRYTSPVEFFVDAKEMT
jgi:hypothetical protein